jgi:chorismate synthase
MSHFGRVFRVSTFGESHCAGVGCIVDGVPPRIALTEADIQPQLSRRRPGQSHLSTPRDEKDQVKILSGTEKGYTLGTPIALLVPNEDQRPKDYKEMDDVPRPSHADFTYQLKYGVRASSGGGRSSARETIGRVAAGAIAEKWLKDRYGVEIVSWVSAVGDKEASRSFETKRDLTREMVDASLVRCPDAEAEKAMIAEIEACKAAKDSVGGVVTVVCRNVPGGLGEPCFDKLEAMFAHAMLSIPATKGFEIGSGFAGAKMHGSNHNDMFVATNLDEERKHSPASPVRKIRTLTNNSGGIQGGISNGEDIVIRIAFKPPATIGREQKTCSFEGTDSLLEAKGRHDPCVVPRAVPIVEAMAALVLADAALLQESRIAASSLYSNIGKVGSQ